MMGKSWGGAGVELGSAVASVWQNLTPTRLDVGVSIPHRRPFESVRAYRSRIGADRRIFEPVRPRASDGLRQARMGSNAIAGHRRISNAAISSLDILRLD